jgi:predicted RNase H-like HicB family nuclease
MKMELTIITEKGENGFYVGQIQEYPAVLSQGETIEELKENLTDALKLILGLQKEKLTKEYSNR